ncbi:MAG TPA: DUF2934 domain-containing protein [Nitrospirales bacterium]|nr:DUF2934 domain-containing protein [Nitrospirales bacterium]
MRSQKSDNEESPSKGSASRLPKSKMVVRTTKPKSGNKGKSHSLAQPVEPQNGAGTIHFPTEQSVGLSEWELQERIAKRSYELFEQRGGQHGNDQADWFQAAKEVLTLNGVGKNEWSDREKSDSRVNRAC